VRYERQHPGELVHIDVKKRRVDSTPQRTRAAANLQQLRDATFAAIETLAVDEFR
jgi:hypothetical protein